MNALITWCRNRRLQLLYILQYKCATQGTVKSVTAARYIIKKRKISQPQRPIPLPLLRK